VGGFVSAGHLLLAGFARLTVLFLLTALRAGETLALLFSSLESHTSLFDVTVITPVAVLFLSLLALRRTVPADVTSPPSLSSALIHCRFNIPALLLIGL
jgi:hypothetical protein